MLQLHTIKPNPGAKHRKKRLGNGESSGLGKTCGKGNKGQKARSGGTIRPGFEGGLRAAKLVQGPCDAVKLLGNGTLTKNLNVVVDFVSASAREKVTQAGGTVTVLSEA